LVKLLESKTTNVEVGLLLVKLFRVIGFVPDRNIKLLCLVATLYSFILKNSVLVLADIEVKLQLDTLV
jgi:hypothetical protein